MHFGRFFTNSSGHPAFQQNVDRTKFFPSQNCISTVESCYQVERERERERERKREKEKERERKRKIERERDR
jgi:hypothetical protein